MGIFLFFLHFCNAHHIIKPEEDENGGTIMERSISFLLIAALLLKEEPSAAPGRRAEGILWCYLACELVLNLPGYLQLAQFITG